MPTDKSSRYAVLWAVGAAALLITAPAVRAADSWPDLSKSAGAVGGGERDAAVIVGAENYAFVEHVPGAKQNANDWQAYLTETLKVPADRVTLLLDNDATNDAIRQAAVEKASQVEDGGTLWFVFIGHGAPSKDGKDGLLVGIDAQQKASSVYSRSFSRNELLGLLAKGKQAKTVVLIDACFSGKAPSGQALVAGLQPLLTMRALPAGIDSRTVLMTAARSDQFAGPLPGGSRPAFSYLALGGLRGWAANAQGQVTASSLVDYIRGALSLSRDRTQTPELSTPETAAVVLGKGREAGPDLAKIQREAASSSGRGFQVTNLEAVPTAEAPKELGQAASGLDLSNVDVDALEKYDAAVKFEKGDAAPTDKAETWRQLGKDAPKFAELAGKRAEEWDRFAMQKKAAEEAKEKRIVARDADWAKLGRLLSLGVVSAADKSAWSGQFVKAYLKSPGLEPMMAKALAAHVAAGPTREALNKLALKAPKEEETAAAPARAAAGKAGIQWVNIPGGKFTMMGAYRGDPPHEVAIKSFQMAKTLVTNKQYKACVAAGACTPATSEGVSFEGDAQPVVGVDWNQAKSFSVWAGGRLPTEAEWEYAARSGGKDQKYPWGNEDATCERAVISGCGSATAPVCSKPEGKTQQGLCDMAGNAWEWVQDSWHGSYAGAPTDGSAWEEAGSNRVLRGGSWYYYAGFAESANRDIDAPGRRRVSVSFRLARDTADGTQKAPRASEEESAAVMPSQAQTSTSNAGIQWVRIPAGKFTMGANDLGWHSQPHEVTIKSFQMAKTLVTNKQYKACVTAGACAAATSQGSQYEGDDQPVVGVDWNQAKAFSTWAGGRLPTESEWEYAARSGGKDQKYPWGNEDATCERAVILGCGGTTAPVCSKPAGNTEQGLCDMAGNAEEWVEDWYHDTYNGAPTDGSAWEETNSNRENRGGSWIYGAGNARSANRSGNFPSARNRSLGFRVAR